MKYPVLAVDLGQPAFGYWDYGAKRYGEFTPEFVPYSPISHSRVFRKGGIIKWGCWGFNFWFNAGAGKSWKEAASIAMRKLRRTISRPANITIEWREE